MPPLKTVDNQIQAISIYYDPGQALMLWNLLIHTALGILGRTYLVWSTEAITAVICITAVIQGIDMFSFYNRIKASFFASQAGQDAEKVDAWRKGLKIKLPQVYILKVVWYSFITLFVATAARAVIM